jgi:5-methylcytosine-specific restriction endonuclease McrA
MAKAFARKFYSSKAWQDCRNEYAKRKHFLCENCLRRGIYRPGEIVHHLIELDPMNIDNPEITLNFDNLELLCRDCHAEVHEQSGGRWAEVNRRKKESREKNNRYIIEHDGRVSAR